MKGFLQEYGIIMVVVSVVLGMLTFGKMGYAKNIQDAILGSADHIVETGENITKKEVDVKSGDTLDIEGAKYIVLEQRENSKALVIMASSIGDRAFQSKARADKQNMSTYEGSDIDNYLENNWYKGLSAKMQKAIQTADIKQASYMAYDDHESMQETGPNGQVYNTISRHVFLPGVGDISKVVNLKDTGKVQAFLNGISIWTRDSYQGFANFGEILDAHEGSLHLATLDLNGGIRPAFVIDLSEIDYTEAGHVDYK